MPTKDVCEESDGIGPAGRRQSLDRGRLASHRDFPRKDESGDGRQAVLRWRGERPALAKPIRFCLGGDSPSLNGIAGQRPELAELKCQGTAGRFLDRAEMNARPTALCFRHCAMPSESYGGGSGKRHTALCPMPLTMPSGDYKGHGQRGWHTHKRF